ncbi:hypothetical protein [Vulgatibacter sp.]|uniref:hypothetical protein n=1 Tax=Vulgatibacter sp. TaxID=1971226 RepID=UPI0035644531
MNPAAAAARPVGGLATGFAPSFRLIQAHFWLGLAGLCLFAAGLVFVAPTLEGHFFQPRLLGLVHLCVLGWLLPIALGAMHQLVPVVFEVPVRSERIAWVALFLFAAGAAGLVGHMWSLSVGWGFPAAAALLTTSVILYAWNLLSTLARKATMTLTGVYVIASLFWLLLAVGFGMALAWHLHAPWLQMNHLLLLRAHAHAAGLGFFGLLIMGVAYRLLEMFLLSYGASERAGRAAFLFVNAGLIGLVIGFVTDGGVWTIAAAAAIAAGVCCFLLQVRTIHARRMRKKTDSAWHLTFASFAYLASAAAVGLGLVLWTDPPHELVLAYGLIALPGFVGSVVIGQLYKILPFLVWLHRFSPYVGLKKVPAASEILPEAPKRIQAVLMHAGLLTLLAGMGTGSGALRLAGALGFAASALLATRNFSIILRSRP